MAIRVQPTEPLLDYQGCFPRTLDQAFGYRAQLDLENDQPHVAYTLGRVLRYVATLGVLGLLTGVAVAFMRHGS